MAASWLKSNVQDLRRTHMKASKRILTYPNSTMNHTQNLKPGLDDQISACTDSKWGSQHETKRKGRSGIVINYGKASVYTDSKLQKVLTLGSVKAEYVELLEECNSTAWLRRLTSEFGLKQRTSAIA